MRKKGTPQVLIRSVFSLCEGGKIMVKVDSESSEVFEVKVGMHQRSVLFHFLFALVVDIVTEFVREGALSELLYADDLVMMSETIKGLKDNFLKWRESFERKGLKVNLGKTKIMVSSGITHDGLSKSKVEPGRVSSLRVRLTQYCVHSVVDVLE